MASTNSAQFTGRENDDAGLLFYRARYYSPATGRFISEDPLGLLAGTNLYGYVFSSPTNFVDPTGLWAFWDDLAFTTGGAVAGMAGQALADLITGQWSCWTTYVGAGLGGAAGGEALLYGGPIAAGAAGGAVSNAATQVLNMATDTNRGSAPEIWQRVLLSVDYLERLAACRTLV
jgi:type VI secretion system secreted protein VgrG